MPVARVQDDDGSHIEPPLDPAWDELTKLQWQAAVVAADTGLQVEVYPQDQPGRFGFFIGRGSVASFDFYQAWTFLIGASLAAKAVREQLVPEPVAPAPGGTPPADYDG